MLQVSQLFIYPIKSLGGIQVSSAIVTDRGFKYDRRWMLVDDNGRFLTQREHPLMALLSVSLLDTGLRITYQPNPADSISIYFDEKINEQISAQVWDDTVPATLVSQQASDWLSQKINCSCRLVYMQEHTQRLIDPQYNIGQRITSFADGYPMLLISQASLDDLNRKCSEPIPMNRFRPNIVISGAQPFEEDSMKEFVINQIHWQAVKPCARCVMTTINQQTAHKGKEPLKTLATYRSKNNKIYFGENIIAMATGSIQVGNSITVLQHKQPLF
ncbi:MAG: hypothetical protein RL172_1704 [Bacteroidota bacterium]